MAIAPLVVDPAPHVVDPVGRLLSIISEIPMDAAVDRWLTAGITWQPKPSRGFQGGAIAVCNPASPTASGNACVAAVSQLPFGVYDSLNATYVDTEVGWVDALLDERWPTMISSVFAKELLDGALSASGFSFSSQAHAPAQRTFLAGSVTVSQGIAILEDDLARTLYNAYGLIHLGPVPFQLAVGAQAIHDEGGVWKTGRGNTVISDAGYVDAKEPTGQVASPAMKDWIYASGPVRYASSGVQRPGNAANEFSDMTRNTFVRWTMGYGILQFDPAPVAAILVDY